MKIDFNYIWARVGIGLTLSKSIFLVDEADKVYKDHIFVSGWK